MNEDNAERPMHDATCSNCGKETKVPFQPSGERPVYCDDCFRDVRSKRRDSFSGGGGNRPMYDATCAECGQPTQVPFQPTQGRPVYCREHYQKHRG